MAHRISMPRTGRCDRPEKVRAYFILGLPGQTAAEVLDTAGVLRGLGASVFPSIYYNVQAPREQWLMQRSSAFYNETEELSREELMRLFNECSGGWR